MSLRTTQSEHVKAISKLIDYAEQHGWELTWGDAYRDPRVHGAFGEKKSYAGRSSVHKVRLAVDFNLFVDGKFITDGNHDAYQALGHYWKTLHPLARWGGDFNDANHFSFEYQGKK